MADETKAFYLVTGMSEAFRKWEKDVVDALNGEELMELWKARIALAQAQQLTMISESLKTISETLKMVLKVSSSAPVK